MLSLRRLLLLLPLLLALPALAQEAAAPEAATPPPTAAQTLDRLDNQIDALQVELQKNPDSAALAELRNTALGLQDQAGQLAGTLKPQVDSLNTRLAVLGPAPAKGAPPEAPEVSAQRRQLDKDKAALDAQLKQAQLLGEESMQLAAQAAGMRRDQFQAQLASRTPSPLGRVFWSDLVHQLPDDLVRLKRLGERVADDWHGAWQPPNRTPLALCLLGAALLLAFGRRLLEYGLMLLARRLLPEGRLRRSALAVGISLVSVLVIGLAAELAYLGLDWNDALDAESDAFTRALVWLIAAAAYLGGVGRALLSARRASWRLPALSDAAAKRLAPFPWLLAGASLLFLLIEQINGAIGASLPATVASRGLTALVVGGLVGAALLRLGHARRALIASGERPARRPLWVGLLAVGAALGVALSWLGVAAGFIAFAYFIATQMLWVGLVVATLYLWMHLVQDLIETLLSPEGPNGQRVQSAFDLPPQRLEQAATVLSGVGRVVLFLLAVVVVLAPFGTGPRDLLDRVGRSLSGGTFGQLPIVPGDIFNALLVLVFGLLAVRMLKNWLGDQLLAKTGLELGIRSSIVSLIGYVCLVVVITLALAELKISLQSLTWIASALSVGIGFGLQAIVSNFISGLILLAERPVKVGDWVSISGAEGDIRRINVRATEIQLSDRSTVIVPNSQLITQNVRNVTMAHAQGRVQFRLPMPLDTDATQARQIMLGVLQAHPSVLDTPAASVLLETIDASAMSFLCTGYVKSPREVSAVKSDLLFAMLEKLREAKLPLSRPQDMVLHRPAPPAPA
ncbi:DUF3772 domain-containing protein [Frateuria defendens]|uniref:DUF3772 domain-containing protein n=1 Tax=Frateuria defendens TaxID=2219559 RepID=UPI00066FFDD2|nr:DUF3772 domain-containing protein [Frateuria defendens]